MKHSTFGHDVRSCLSFVAIAALGACAAPAFAAGLECSRAATGTEKAICADENLRKLDVQLSTVYSRLAAAQPGQRGELRRAQLDWLKTRDRCGTDTGCIATRHEERLTALQAQLRYVDAYKPDDVDREALQELQQAVEAMRKTDAEFPLEKVIDALSIKTGTTSFFNTRDGNRSGEDGHFPTVQPKGVTADEWRALRASGIEGGGENGAGSYTLMDIDGDGQRDLVINTYVGGTGLFNEISVLRRKGAKFTGVGAPGQSGQADASGPSSLYMTNGRGSNQAAEWVLLRGRVYAAYRNSQYGVDNVYLLRPLTVVGGVPTLTVRYRYRLSIPKVQKDEEKGPETTLDSTLHAALTRALGLVNTREAVSADKPLCPIPEGTSDDDRSNYTSYGPGHYSYEIVGDVPVRIGPQCYIGRLVDWFGRYTAKGKLLASFSMRKPLDFEREQTYTVQGVRSVVGTAASISAFDFGN
ncbi:lysozyme inhibitor LprI family protein [Variovorax sp. W2I14]|uniref:lysozyme inhibitor LprI family protein n=1 Tax=Variovorax sp. W2I14 TaxID=3042290 RepID=UPI003D1E38F8